MYLNLRLIYGLTWNTLYEKIQALTVVLSEETIYHHDINLHVYTVLYSYLFHQSWALGMHLHLKQY